MEDFKKAFDSFKKALGSITFILIQLNHLRVTSFDVGSLLAVDTERGFNNSLVRHLTPLNPPLAIISHLKLEYLYNVHIWDKYIFRVQNNISCCNFLTFNKMFLLALIIFTPPWTLENTCFCGFPNNIGFFSIVPPCSKKPLTALTTWLRPYLCILLFTTNKHLSLAVFKTLFINTLTCLWYVCGLRKRWSKTEIFYKLHSQNDTLTHILPRKDK